MCKVMQASRSGYYSYLKVLSGHQADKETTLLVAIKVLAAQSRNSYGSRRIAKALQRQGYPVGRFRTRRLMRKAEVVCLQRRCYVITTTKSKPGLPVAENRLQRQFDVDAPNRVWTVDITYLSTQEGWLYLAIVLDLFSRRIIGWCLDKHLRETLAGNALQMALTRRTPTGSLMHHSDRGCQYTSATYQARLKLSALTVSMSQAGNCYDNAVAERFFSSLKSERTDQEIYHTRAQAKSAVIDYIEGFYNSQRLHSTLGHRTPIHYEQAHGFS